jgi:Ca2+-binding RTX toxin-like protein
MATFTFTIGDFVNTPSVQDALGSFQLLELDNNEATSFTLTDGIRTLSTVTGNGLLYGIVTPEDGPFLVGGEITGFNFVQANFSGGADRVVLNVTGLSLPALRFDELFFGRPGHSLQDAIEVSRLMAVGNDLFNGSDGSDIMNGGEGSDTMSGGDGADFIGGDAGRDVLTGDGGRDNLSGGAKGDLVAGGDDNDILSGGGGIDELFGGRGNDFVDGNGGRDTLSGDAGADTMNGGAGRDSFVFDVLSGRERDADTIQRFITNKDKLVFSAEVFDALGPVGPLQAGALAFGRTAQDDDDRILYHRRSGDLFYDADGEGGDAAVLIAIMDGFGRRNPELRLSNFSIQTIDD